MIFFWKNGRFSGRIWPDWGNTAWADMAGLGSKSSHPPASLFKTNQFVANLRRFTDSLGERYSRLGDDLPRGKEEEEEVSEEIKKDRGPPPRPGGCLCEKEAVSFYCSECELLSCPSCVTTRHKSHSVGLLEDKANKERDRVTATAHQARLVP